MKINAKLRDNLITMLPDNYRHIVSEREGCHPNTVYNVLHHEHDNPAVALAILTLAKETRDEKLAEERQRKAAQKIAKQLSADSI